MGCCNEGTRSIVAAGERGLTFGLRGEWRGRGRAGDYVGGGREERLISPSQFHQEGGGGLQQRCHGCASAAALTMQFSLPSRCRMLLAAGSSA